MSLPHSLRAKAYSLLLINIFIWGISVPIIKYSLGYVSAHQFLLGRYLIASLIFLPLYYFWFGHPKTPSISSLKLILLALLGTPLTLIPLYYGLQLTSSIDAAVIIATGPLITIIGGRLFLKETVSSREKVGIIIALLGTLVVVLEPVINSKLNLLQSQSSLLGNSLIFLSNFIWTAFLLIDKKQRVNPAQISLLSYLISVPVFSLIVLIEPVSTTDLLQNIFSSPATPGIIFMAIFGSIIAFWAYTAGQKFIEASEAAVFTYLEPLFTLPLAVFWLKESIQPTFILGCLIITSGVFISQIRRS